MNNDDIINSLNYSFIKNGWGFGELFNRIEILFNGLMEIN